MSNQSWLCSTTSGRAGGGRGTAHTATRVTTTTTKRRRQGAGKLKGPRRSSICEGCNGVRTGLAALRTAHCRKRRGEEKKANLGDIYCRNRGIGRPSIARSLPLRSSSSRPSIPLSSLFQVPIYFSNLASLLLRRSVLSVAMLKAVSRPSIHSPPLSPSLPLLGALIGLAFRPRLSHSGSVTSSISIPSGGGASHSEK